MAGFTNLFSGARLEPNPSIPVIVSQAGYSLVFYLTTLVRVSQLIRIVVNIHSK